MADFVLSPDAPACHTFTYNVTKKYVLQFDSNIVTENTYSDIYVYYGATEEVPEVSPFTGVNVNNVFS